MRILVLLCVIAVQPVAASLRPLHDRPADPGQVTALLAEAVGEDDPGVAAAIVAADGGVLSIYRGKANLDWDLPLDGSSRFYLGSLAKPLVAAAVMFAVDEKRVVLDAPVSRYLADMPPWADQVRIHHLLHMTSGIRDYLKLRDFAGDPKFGPFDNESAMAQLRRQSGLVFAPGERYQYSNSNYVLLWEILETVTEGSLETAMDRRVLKPLGMTSTHFESDHTGIVPNRVTSYQKHRDGSWHRYLKTFASTGDGGAWGTLPDLIAWDKAVRTPPAAFPALERMKRTRALENGAPGPYGAGMFVRTWRGLPVLEHGGFMLGFQHHWMYLPDQNISVILMSSNAEIDFFALRDDLVELALGEDAPAARSAESSEAETASPEIAVTTAPRAHLAGCFHNAEIPLSVALDVAEGTLHFHPSSFRRIPMKRETAGSFTAMGGEIRVVIDDAGDAPIPGFLMEHASLGAIYFTRMPSEQCAFSLPSP